MRATEPLGIVADARRFQPHVTLARRARRATCVRSSTCWVRRPSARGGAVDDVTLLASDTRPDGARYTEVSRIPLAR